ncbi:MAG: patatin family protein [Lachnospiraceae bacterium]|nr:patatin family protein [Lachnospiraceae bacterium]
MRKKTGLVLEGGGMRGIYTAGVLDVFMEEGIHFDGVIGVSAGAIHGCSFVAEQKGRNIRYYKKYCNDKRFISFWNFLRYGDIVGEEFCYHELPEVLEPYDYDTFDASETEFYVTCSNLETGKAEYLKLTDMKAEIDLIRASASLPYVSKVVEYNGMKLLDGGCTDSIPIRAFLEMGFLKSVVILTRDRDYIKKPENPHLPMIFFHKYPKFVKALGQRHIRYNKTRASIEKLEKSGKIFVIRPSEELNIGRMEKNPDEIQRIYDIGVKDAKHMLQSMKAWIEQ